MFIDRQKQPTGYYFFSFPLLYSLIDAHAQNLNYNNIRAQYKFTC